MKMPAPMARPRGRIFRRLSIVHSGPCGCPCFLARSKLDAQCSCQRLTDRTEGGGYLEFVGSSTRACASPMQLLTSSRPNVRFAVPCPRDPRNAFNSVASRFRGAWPTTHYQLAPLPKSAFETLKTNTRHNAPPYAYNLYAPYRADLTFGLQVSSLPETDPTGHPSHHSRMDLSVGSVQK